MRVIKTNFYDNRIYIQENRTETFKKGDKVVMHTCHESTFYKDKVWICQTDSFLDRGKQEVVFLEDFSGYFSAKFLKKHKKSAHQIWAECKEKNMTNKEFKEQLKANGIISSKETES